MRATTLLRSTALTSLSCILLLFMACQRDTYQRDAAEVRKSVDQLKDSLREVRGTLTHEGLTSTFTARVDEKNIYYVAEAFDVGPESGLVKGENEYYLDGPYMMVYGSRRIVREMTGAIGEPKTVDLELFFNQKGDVVQQRKAVNGSPSTPEKAEVESVVNRFKALYTEVRRQGSL